MAGQERVNDLVAKQRQTSAALGGFSDTSGRGPTYERVQRLLEERRARAQAQLGAQTTQQGPADAYDAPLGRGRLQQVLPKVHSPAADTGQSFEFDRPNFISGGGALAAAQGLLRESYSAGQALPLRRAPTAGAYTQQRAWGSSLPMQFQVPPGDLDDEDSDPVQHKAAQRYPQDFSDQYGQPQQHQQQLDQGLAASGLDPDGQPTLAQLEAMLNQTMLQLNLSAQPQQPHTMRVPSTKDMAFGMGGGEGPFDISDIWAMESQPSVSHHSASQSEHGAPRDDGHEVNSYAAASSGQRRQTGGQQTSRAGRQPGAQHAEQQMPARGQEVPRRPAAAPMPSHVQRQAQQQLPRPRPPSPATGGLRGSAAAHPADKPRQQQPPRPLSAQYGMPSGAQQPHGAPALHRSVSPAGGQPGPRPRSAYQHVTPRYNQPPSWAQCAAAGSMSPDQITGFTFRPRINPRSREIAERLLPRDRDRRLEQLSRPRNERFEQRAEQLRQAKDQEELRDCTFQPRTGRPPSTPRVRGAAPVHDRLYNVKPGWQLKREDILREREQAALASCTFQPQCGSRQSPNPVRRSSSAPRRRPPSATACAGGGMAGGGGGSAPYVPIHQRVADLLRSRNEKLAKAQMRMELDGGSVTFQPEINRRSVQIAAERQRQQPADVATLPANERLYRLAQEQRAASANRRAGGEDLGASFGDVSVSRDQRPGVPSINPRSRALAESSDLPQNFLARQAYLAALGHEKRALYRSLLEESTCTFQPQLLNLKGGSLASSGCFAPASGAVPGPGSWSGGSAAGDREQEREGDRLSKLAYEDVQRSAALRDALAQHHYSQFTFTPHINERSRRLGRRHSLTDLHQDEQRQAKLERLAVAAEAQRNSECTFQPAINPRSASMGRQRRGSLVLASVESHEQANKLRSSILVEARALREYEELKECTFTPAINRSAPKPAGPVAVPGLGRHMELRDMARRKREVDEARKAEVWNARPKSPGPRVGATVPQPFSFDARIMPWQRPRSEVLHEQQQHQQQQKMALATLKQQRQQQRQDSEERRSAHLQRIMQEAQLGQGAKQQQHQGRRAPDEYGIADAPDGQNYGGGSPLRGELHMRFN